MDVLTSAEFVRTEQMVIAAILAAVTTTPVGAYYPDVDVTIQWRKGKPLPTVELVLKRKAELTAPMQTS